MLLDLAHVILTTFNLNRPVPQVGLYGGDENLAMKLITCQHWQPITVQTMQSIGITTWAYFMNLLTKDITWQVQHVWQAQTGQVCEKFSCSSLKPWRNTWASWITLQRHPEPFIHSPMLLEKWRMGQAGAYACTWLCTSTSPSHLCMGLNIQLSCYGVTISRIKLA